MGQLGSFNELFKKRKRAGNKEVRSILATAQPSTSFASAVGDADATRATMRIRSLGKLLEEGKVDQTALGDYDKGLLSIYQKRNSGAPQAPGTGDEDSTNKKFLGVLGKVGPVPIGEGLSNFFTGDNEVGLGVGPMFTSIPGSIYESAKAVGSDIKDKAKLEFHPENIANPLDLKSPITIDKNAIANQSGTNLSDIAPETTDKIIKPMLKHYKEKYSGSLGEVVNKMFIKDPLGTALDAGTILSGGTAATVRAGSLTAKVGENAANLARRSNMPRLGNFAEGVQRKGQSMASLLTQEGRAPLRPSEAGTYNKAMAPEIERRYSNRPVVKGSQKLMDYLLESTPVGKIPTPTLKTGEANYVTGRTLRETRDIMGGVKRTLIDSFGNSRAMGAMIKAQESKPFTDAAKQLTPKEMVAFMLAKNGINFQVIRGTLTGVEAYRRNLEKSIAGDNPTGYNIRDQRINHVDPEYGNFMLKSLNDPEVLDHIRNPTDGMMEASNKWDDQVVRTLEVEGIDPQVHQRRIYAGQTIMRVKPERLEEIATKEGIDVQDLLADTEKMQEIANIKDPAASFERYAAKQDGDVINPNYVPQAIATGKFTNKKGVPKFAKKEGKRMKRATAAEAIQDGAAAKDYLKRNDFQAFLSGAMRVDPGVIIGHIAARERMLMNNGWLMQVAEKLGAKIKDAEGDHQLAMASSFDEMARMGFDKREYGLLNIQGTIQFFEHENDFVKNIMEVMENLDELGPAHVAANSEGILKSVNDYMEASGMATNQKILGASRPQGVVMPKTAINYIRETFEAQMKADTGFRHIMNVWRTFVLAYTPRWWLNTAVGSTMLSIMAGSMRPKYMTAARRYSSPEKAVALAKKAPDIRYGLQGTEHVLEDRRRNKLTDNKVADTIFTKVENLEGFFKRAGFFKFLDDRAKQSMREMGDVIDGYRKGVFTDEYLQNLLENHPKLVAGALDDTNKFFYNYNVLGTFERRYIRMFVPFWGWYKFITKLTWQLPMHYPGKMNIVQKLGEVTDDMTDKEFGLLPPQMVGAVLLNRQANGDTDYIPTFGLNPFSDFMNPGDGLEGLLSTQQFSPLIQAGASAAGLDTYRGTQVQNSPDGRFGQGLFGNTYDLVTGKEQAGGMTEGGFRFIGSLGRSLPVLRMGEEILAGNKGVYANSIPLIRERPLPMEGTSLFDTIMSNIGGAVGKHTKNLNEYHKYQKSDLKRARGAKKSEKKRLRKYDIK